MFSPVSVSIGTLYAHMELACFVIFQYTGISKFYKLFNTIYMPHVSPKKVNNQVSGNLYKLLFSAIIDRNISKKQQQAAFDELLTPTEKIMLGKRLAAISMLSQGASSYKTGKTLQLSPTTTTKLQVKLEKGKFLNASKLCNMLRKGPLQHYIENLFKPLPRYGTSPMKLFKEM